MIKLIVAIKRNPDMSPAEFHRYWRTVHAEKVRALPAAKRYIRRYVQAHTMDSEYAAGEPSYDGTAELWFDSAADKDAFYSDPEYLAKVRPDEGVFADMTNTRFFVTREEDVKL
ncbi:MAG: EthD domain-containing protein [Gemmatimonadaceae bacterium]